MEYGRDILDGHRYAAPGSVGELFTKEFGRRHGSGGGPLPDADVTPDRVNGADLHLAGVEAGNALMPLTIGENMPVMPEAAPTAGSIMSHLEELAMVGAQITTPE